MPKRLTINEVRSYFEQEEYTLVSTEYVNAHKHLTVICNNGHEYDTTLNNFKYLGKRCKRCTEGKAGEKLRNPIEKVYDSVISNNFIFIKWIDTYKNNTSKLLVKCENGHLFETDYIRLSKRCQCKKCYENLVSEKLSFEYCEVKVYIESFGYKLISNHYKNAYSELDLICPNGHNYRTNLHNFKNKNNRCLQCHLEECSGDGHWNWKGGITPIHHFLRNNLDEWKKSSMENCNYKCIITGDRFDQIHHIVSVNLIIEETFNELQINKNNDLSVYTNEELLRIKSKFLEIHNHYPLGVCLRNDIHNLFHSIYGWGNNTEYQWNEFLLAYT